MVWSSTVNFCLHNMFAVRRYRCEPSLGSLAMNSAFFCGGIRLCLHYEAVEISKSWWVSAIVRSGLYLIIVDSNATRRGGFVQGSGPKVVTSGLFREYRPDLHLLAKCNLGKGGHEAGGRNGHSL